MRGDIPLLRHYVFLAWCLVKHRDNFTVTSYSNISRLEDKTNKWLDATHGE